MKQELLDSIKSHYEDYKVMVKTDFSELQDEMITPGRKKLVENIKALHDQCIEKEIDVDDTILSEAIKVVLGTNDNKKTKTGKTNGILMYMGKFEYETYAKLMNLELGNKYPNKEYILYMDIENNKMYFVTKEKQEKFEQTHNVIVTYKNPNCNDGWNFERNYQYLPDIRREFIKKAMYLGQEESSIQFIKKYKETSKN